VDNIQQCILRGDEIRALSWKQPFASAMLAGKIETRTWATKYRGLVLICTSLQAYSEEIEDKLCGKDLYRSLLRVLGSQLDTLDHNGFAIAIGRLVDCFPMQPVHEEKCFVQWRQGLYCHVYSDVRKIQPFRWKGSQGWRVVDPETRKLIKLI
jgi:hypothetical protein